MSRRQDLGRVGVDGAVVDVAGRGDGAGHADVLGGRFDLRVAELERHGDEGADGEGAPAADVGRLDQYACDDRAEETRDLVDGVVAPGRVFGAAAHVGAARGEVVRKEDAVQRADHADHEPVCDDHGRGVVWAWRRDPRSVFGDAGRTTRSSRCAGRGPGLQAVRA